jgi:hypothetical protein
MAQDTFEPALLTPITGIPCREQCNPGQYFTVNTTTRKYQCSKCPKNTFSNGGGISINGDFGEWKTALQANSSVQERAWIKQTCYKYSCKLSRDISFIGFSWFHSDCQPCSASPGGEKLVCGNASAKNTSVAFEMEMRLYFVKRGKVEFLYRKDSVKEKDGWVSGFFSFFVDDESVLDDSSLGEDPEKWKYFSYEVFPGMKEVSFVY